MYKINKIGWDNSYPIVSILSYCSLNKHLITFCIGKRLILFVWAYALSCIITINNLVTDQVDVKTCKFKFYQLT